MRIKIILTQPLYYSKALSKQLPYNGGIRLLPQWHLKVTPLSAEKLEQLQQEAYTFGIFSSPFAIACFHQMGLHATVQEWACVGGTSAMHLRNIGLCRHPMFPCQHAGLGALWPLISQRIAPSDQLAMFSGSKPPDHLIEKTSELGATVHHYPLYTQIPTSFHRDLFRRDWKFGRLVCVTAQTAWDQLEKNLNSFGGSLRGKIILSGSPQLTKYIASRHPNLSIWTASQPTPEALRACLKMSQEAIL